MLQALSTWMCVEQQLSRKSIKCLNTYKWCICRPIIVNKRIKRGKEPIKNESIFIWFFYPTIMHDEVKSCVNWRVITFFLKNFFYCSTFVRWWLWWRRTTDDHKNHYGEGNENLNMQIFTLDIFATQTIATQIYSNKRKESVREQSLSGLCVPNFHKIVPPTMR